MCGIVGYISKTENSYKEEKAHFMRFALALDTLRGSDSTGVMTVKDKFKVDVIKTLMPGDRFVHSSSFKKKWEPGWAQVGHNRAATKGEVTVQNAHPFQDGPITLVHNGTLWAGGQGLPTVNPKLEVDSAQIAHNFALVGPDKAAHVLEEIDGSFALVWYDDRDESINVARNSERPFHYSVGARRDVMYFMSDGSHLAAILKSMRGRTGAASTIYSLNKGLHLKWKKGDLTPEVVSFVPFVPVVNNYSRTSQPSAKKGNEGSALENATKKWERNVQSYGAKKSGVGSPPKVKIGSNIRSVPEPMLKTLKEEYDLTPDEFLEFIPQKAYAYDKDNFMVVGEVVHREWGECLWRSVLTNATKIQAQAYMNTSWLVRPTGVGLPWDSTNSGCMTPSIRTELIHCDWKSYWEGQQRQRERNEREAKIKEAADKGKALAGSHSQNTGYVKGPGGVMIPLAAGVKLSETGCVSCGMVGTLAELQEWLTVNEGRDILCPGCINELSETIPH